MAPEISRSPDTNIAVTSGMQAVAAAIAKAADPQAVESIDQAIQSFAWASIKDKQTVSPEWSGFLGEAMVSPAGFADSPSKYFANANDPANFSAAGFSGIGSTDQVLASLRNTSIRFEDGVASFLRTGIQEALTSIKINANQKIPPTPMPMPLDEVLSADKLKTPDPAVLQPSMRVMNDMFSTLKKVQSAVSDLEANRLRFIRA